MYNLRDSLLRPCPFDPTIMYMPCWDPDARGTGCGAWVAVSKEEAINMFEIHLDNITFDDGTDMLNFYDENGDLLTNFNLCVHAVDCVNEALATPGGLSNLCTAIAACLAVPGWPAEVTSSITDGTLTILIWGTSVDTTDLCPAISYCLTSWSSAITNTITNGTLNLLIGWTSVDTTDLCPAIAYCLTTNGIPNGVNLFTINGDQYTTGWVYTTGAGGAQINTISGDANQILVYGSDWLPFLSCEMIQDCIGAAILAGTGITYDDAADMISTTVNAATACITLNAISPAITDPTGYRIPVMDGTNCGYINLSNLVQNDLGIWATGRIEQWFPLTRNTETLLSGFVREWIWSLVDNQILPDWTSRIINKAWTEYTHRTEDTLKFVDTTQTDWDTEASLWFVNGDLRYRAHWAQLFFADGNNSSDSSGIFQRYHDNNSINAPVKHLMSLAEWGQLKVGDLAASALYNTPLGNEAKFYVRGWPTLLENSKTIWDEILTLNGRVPYSFLDCNNLHNIESRPKDRAGICVRPSVASTQGRIFSFDDHEDNQIVMMYSQIHPTAGYLDKFNIVAPYCISHRTADTATFAVTEVTFEDRSVNVLYVDTTITQKVILPETGNAKGRVFRIKIIDDTNPLEIEVQNTGTQRVEERQTYNIVPNFIKPAGDGLDCLAYHLRWGTRYLI